MTGLRLRLGFRIGGGMAKTVLQIYAVLDFLCMNWNFSYRFWADLRLNPCRWLGKAAGLRGLRPALQGLLQT
jgi:hypothetical protein